MVEKADNYECMKYLASKVAEELVISGIGFFEWQGLTAGREANLPIGQMGTTLPLAMGIAFCLPDRRVICLTTDGDLLMDLSVLPPLGKEKPNNMIVVVNDNEHYQQTHSGKYGYWPTMTASGTDLEGIAKACGIRNAVTVRNTKDFANEINSALREMVLKFIVIKTEPSRLKIFRPDIDHTEHKYRFVRYIEKSEGVSILPRERQDRALLEQSKS